MLSDAAIKVKIIENTRSGFAPAELRGERWRRPGGGGGGGGGVPSRRWTEEGMEETDAVVTLTDIDEQNLVVSMFANQKPRAQGGHQINRTE